MLCDMIAVGGVDFHPDLGLQTRPLLRPIGSISLVDQTKFWEGVGDAHIAYDHGDACILEANNTRFT